MPEAAASTIAAKRRWLDDRLGTILTTRTDCDVTQKLLTFMDAPTGLVEPTNNGCERTLRPTVINRKVTNGFRSVWGAEADVAVRSLVDTKSLAGTGPLDAIRSVVTA